MAPSEHRKKPWSGQYGRASLGYVGASSVGPSPTEESEPRFYGKFGERPGAVSKDPTLCPFELFPDDAPTYQCEEITSIVVFECNNPDCDIPQHTVCVADFLYIQIEMRELVSGR